MDKQEYTDKTRLEDAIKELKEDTKKEQTKNNDKIEQKPDNGKKNKKVN